MFLFVPVTMNQLFINVIYFEKYMLLSLYYHIALQLIESSYIQGMSLQESKKHSTKIHL